MRLSSFCTALAAISLANALEIQLYSQQEEVIKYLTINSEEGVELLESAPSPSKFTFDSGKLLYDDSRVERLGESLVLINNENAPTGEWTYTSGKLSYSGVNEDTQVLCDDLTFADSCTAAAFSIEADIQILTTFNDVDYFLSYDAEAEGDKIITLTTTNVVDYHFKGSDVGITVQGTEEEIKLVAGPSTVEWVLDIVNNELSYGQPLSLAADAQYVLVTEEGRVITTNNVDEATTVWSIIDGQLDLTAPAKRAIVEFIVCLNGDVYINGDHEGCTAIPVLAENLEEEPVVPGESTTVPEETTKVPEETTKVPEESTGAPEESTGAPEETTKVPEETTNAEEEETVYTTITTDITITVTDCDEKDICSTSEKVRKTTIETYCPTTAEAEYKTITITSCSNTVCTEVTSVVDKTSKTFETIVPDAPVTTSATLAPVAPDAPDSPDSPDAPDSPVAPNPAPTEYVNSAGGLLVKGTFAVVAMMITLLL
ncbi:hypothetical protein JA1_001188 [Spathaspora sp. JA1]|nr:hypothetical protein JA1_001188 [Spathaspora sp. JA1]